MQRTYRRRIGKPISERDIGTSSLLHTARRLVPSYASSIPGFRRHARRRKRSLPVSSYPRRAMASCCSAERALIQAESRRQCRVSHGTCARRYLSACNGPLLARWSHHQGLPCLLPVLVCYVRAVYGAQRARAHWRPGTLLQTSGRYGHADSIVAPALLLGVRCTMSGPDISVAGAKGNGRRNQCHRQVLV